MKDIEYNYYPLSIRVSQNEKDPQYNIPAEVLNLSNIIPSANGSILASGTIQSPNFSAGNSGWQWSANGDIEAESGKFRGTITATSGKIGGFTLGATEMYGGIIKTAVTVGVGTTGVIMDTAGLRGYDSVLGTVFNLPTDGSAPTFASGIINSTVFNINTNAVLRTSATVGDGTASSAGILINNTGLYACQASQTLADANVKILVNGSGTYKGALVGNSINIPNATSPLFSVDASGNVMARSLQRKDFHWYTLFESIDGYSKTITGTGTFVLGYQYLTMATSATVSDDCVLTKSLPSAFGAFSWDKNRKLRVGINPLSGNIGFTTYIVSGTGGANDRKLGFYISGNSNTAYQLYGAVGNGSGQTLVDLGEYNFGTYIDLEAVYVSGISVKYYVNGSLIATTTTTLPSGTTNAEWLLYVPLTSGGGIQILRLSYYDFWQAI